MIYPTECEIGQNLIMYLQKMINKKMYIFICQISDLARLFIVKMEELVISNTTWQFVFVGLALLELSVKAVRHYLYFISCVFYFSGEEDRRESGVGFHVHKDIVCALLECRPVSNRLISSRLRAATFNIPHTGLCTNIWIFMTVRLTTFTSNSRKPFTKHQRMTFCLYKGIGMLRLGRMLRQTGESFLDPTVMLRQMRENSDF